jgi:predicted DNA-binding transcriptional regulator AlpA
MIEYEFTLKFKLLSEGFDVDDVVERLGSMCDDALVGIGQPGRLALSFTRAARSAESAMVGALSDVKKAVPAAKLVEVTPDFVGLTDVAELIGVSRQNMRKLMLANPDTFPAPIHEGSSALWHLAALLEWLNDRDGYRIDKSLLDVARTAMQINLTKEASQIEQRVQRVVTALVA